jgi:hypothetical protein
MTTLEPECEVVKLNETTVYGLGAGAIIQSSDGHFQCPVQFRHLTSEADRKVTQNQRNVF